jgi:fatty acid desaturase
MTNDDEGNVFEGIIVGFLVMAMVISAVLLIWTGNGWFGVALVISLGGLILTVSGHDNN